MRTMPRLPQIIVTLTLCLTLRVAQATPDCVVQIQPGGQAVVSTAEGAAAFLHALPEVAIARSKATLGSMISQQEIPVSDALGQGTQYQVVFENAIWRIRTYAGQRFLTAQIEFQNHSVAPVQVESLTPWSDPEGCTLGAETNASVILDNGSLLKPAAQLWTAASKDVIGLWNLAAYNPASRRAVIAGFLTNRRAYASVSISRSPESSAAAFAQFRADGRYTPPVVVPPGGGLSSEVFYLSVTETSPLDGLERFAASVQAYNALRPVRRALPHGWDSWVSHYHSDIDEASMLAELAVADRELKRYGWTHFSIDDGWQQKAGDWSADPARFPSGMKALAGAVHARGMTAGIWTEPFTVDLDTPVAREHPEWLLAPNILGANFLGKRERILDVTVPGAYNFLRDVYATITGAWGYDALVETDFLYHLLGANAYTDTQVTQPEALQRGMQAIREGAGADTFIMGVAPFPMVGMVADGMRTGVDCAPIWRNSPKSWAWGCVDTLTNAARRYYFAPGVFALDQDCAFFGHEETRKRWNVQDRPALTWDQQLAWMTGAALTGGAVKIGDAYSLLTPQEFGVLRRLLPVMPKPARPVDLFERNEARLWSLPIACAIGQWQVVAVFNWDEAADATMDITLSQLGLDADAAYAVFDFWKSQYLGTAQGSLHLQVPAGSVRLLSFRVHQDRPMFLATDSHISQGATDFTALSWQDAERTLSGSFNAIEDTDYVLSFLVPAGFTLKQNSFGALPATQTQDGELLQFHFHCAATEALAWSLHFQPAASSPVSS